MWYGCGSPYCSVFSKRVTSQSTGSFWMVTDHELVNKYDIPELHHPLEKVWNYCTIYSIAHTHSCTLYVHQGWIYRFLDVEGYTLTAAGCLQPAKLGQCPPRNILKSAFSIVSFLTLKSNTHKKSSLLSVLILIPRPSLPCPPQMPN